MMVSINNSINNTVGGSNTGVINSLTVTNSSNTASSGAQVLVTVGGATAADAQTTYTISGAQSYAVGIDNSDSDNFKISGSTALGTTDFFVLDSSGQLALGAGNLFIRRSFSGAVGAVINNTDNTVGTSRAAIEMDSGGATGGDALAIFTNTSVTAWSCGLDNSDSDKFKISASGGLGTSDVLSLTTGGDASVVLGNFDVTRSSSGANVSSTISNTSNTASSNALNQITVAGSSANDPFTTYTISGVTNWSTGIDNSASDAYVISASTALGTTNVMSLATGGSVSCVLGDFDVTRSSSGGTVISTISNTSNTASSNSLHQITVAGSSANDPFITYTISGVTNWSTGADNSASDAYKLAASTALGTTDVMIATTAGQVTMPLQSSFSAYKSADTTNVTGDSTAYTVIFDSVLSASYNVGSNYSTSTGLYTAPITGWYQFSGTVVIGAIGAGHTVGFVRILADGENYLCTYFNPASVRTAANECGFPFAAKIFMNAASTAAVVIQVENSTKTITARGFAATNLYTFFSGGLAN